MGHCVVRRRHCWLIWAWSAGVLAGCTPAPPPREYAQVSGMVSYQGEPLTTGTIMFQPDSGAYASAEIQSDGTFSLSGVIGENMVRIVSTEEEGPDPNAPPGLETPPRMKSLIPEEYGRVGSPLRFTVEPGENTVDFELKPISEQTEPAANR